MKFVSWNVNGLRAAWNHGLSSFLETCEADIYAFQETKTGEPFPMAEMKGYYAFWSFCDEKKGYSGTMCLSRQKPVNVRYDMDNSDFDTEGRIITLEFKDFFFINCYVPCSQRSESRYDYRTLWDIHLIQYINRLRSERPVIICGDFNVAVSNEDVYGENIRVQTNMEGFQSTERESLIAMMESGMVDSFRYIYPNEKDKYTWWSNRRFKRKENQGWRLDYFFVSDELKDKIIESTMLSDVLGSDHCPIFLELDMPFDQIEEPRPVKHSSITYRDIKSNGWLAQQVKKDDLTNLWNSIDWEEAEENLKTMQKDSARAAYAHEKEKIAKRQKRIVCSIDAKLLAVRHTCDSASGAGVDGVKWITAQEKMLAALSLTAKEYEAMPSRLLLVKSKNGKQRHIHIETYYDRAMQCLYAYALDPIAEAWGDRKSFAYRKGRSAYDMNEYIKLGLSGENVPTWVLMADVRKCYDNISHDWIMKNIPIPGYMLYQFLKAGYVFGGELFPTDVGVGIGCSISPIIANMTMDGLQDYVYSRLYPHSEIDYPNGNMIRYADDILFMARTEEIAYRIKVYITDFLEERGLTLSPEKTKIVNVADGFTFMSRTYYKSGTQLLTKPSDQAIERFMGNVRDTIENYTGSQKSLIEKLNHKIDGWTAFHRVSEAGGAFRQMDIYISALLLKLCESKHPKWDRAKILQKYWFVDGMGRYCYALPNKKEIRVKFLSDTLLVDYFAVKSCVNPYMDWDYIEFRTKERQVLNVTGAYRNIWNRQEGKCHYCGYKILRDEEKTLIEVYPDKRRFASRMAYVHKRCLDRSFDYIDSSVLPASLSDVRELLEQLESKKKPVAEKYYLLSEFFHTCDKNTITLTFEDIESIMNEKLGFSALRSEYWYRTGFLCISQCWLDNGYSIKDLRLQDRYVVFSLTAREKHRTNVIIPEVIKHGQVPADAKYELENYFRYITGKYGI